MWETIGRTGNKTVLGISLGITVEMGGYVLGFQPSSWVYIPSGLS